MKQKTKNDIIVPKRPTLYDPKEWAIIKRIYFKDSTIDTIDLDELADRKRVKRKQNNSR